MWVRALLPRPPPRPEALRSKSLGSYKPQIPGVGPAGHLTGPKVVRPSCVS